MKQNGFTLVEIMVVISILAVLMVGGSLVLFRTLGSRGENQANININQAGSQTLESLEQSVKFARVVSVGGNTRTNCLAAGSTGVSGTSVLVSDNYGSTTYQISSDRIASIAGFLTKYLSTPDVVASDLEIRWFCVVGSYDKIRVSFDLDDTTVTGGILERTFVRDINMYNSGI